jgi:hypothetical protein
MQGQSKPPLLCLPIITSIGDENVSGLSYNILQRSMKPCSGTRPTALQCAPKTPKFIVYHMNMRRRYNCPYHQAHVHSPAIIVETERTYDEGGSSLQTVGVHHAPYAYVY